jgi:hypothetical protein
MAFHSWLSQRTLGPLPESSVFDCLFNLAPKSGDKAATPGTVRVAPA